MEASDGKSLRTPRIRTAVHSEVVPALRLERVLPTVIRSATARSSLRDMTRSERRPHTGIYSAHGSSAAHGSWKDKHGAQTERINTAGSRHSVASLPGLSAVPSADDLAAGGESSLLLRQEGLPGTDARYSDVHARVSNVCLTHLRKRSHQLQQQTAACKQGIYNSITNSNDPEAMVATKARLKGLAITLTDTSNHKETTGVASMRPPSSSQTGRLEELVFGDKGILLSPVTTTARHQNASPHFTTFLTETEDLGGIQEPAHRSPGREMEGDEGMDSQTKMSWSELNTKVTERLQQSRPTIRPIVKNVNEINSAISIWLRGGCRQAKVSNQGEPIVKNNFDPSGRLAKKKHFERMHHMLEDQKKVLTDPYLDLRLLPENQNIKDFVGYNVEFVDAGLPMVRNAKLLRQVVKRSTSFDRALQNRHQVAQHKLHEVHRKVEYHMPGARALEKAFRAHEVGLAIEVRSMLINVKAIVAMRKFQAIMTQGRIARFRLNSAARKIQRLTRIMKALRKMKGTRCWARSTLKQWLAAVLKYRRAINKTPSVNIIKDFLINLKEAAKVVPTVLRFKAKVLCAQRAIRRFIIRQRKVVEMNTAAWDRAEYKVIKMLYNQKEKQKRGRSTGNAKAVFQRVPSNSKEVLDKIAQLVSELRLPDEVRIEAIRVFMKSCRARFVKERSKYEVELRLYHGQFEKQDMLVSRMMEFMDNADAAQVKSLTDKLSGGAIKFSEKPAPVHLKDTIESEEAMRQIWWRCALEAAMTGKADRLKEVLLGLADENLVDESRIDVDLGPLLRPGRQQARGRSSPDRKGRSSPDRMAARPPAQKTLPKTEA